MIDDHLYFEHLKDMSRIHNYCMNWRWRLHTKPDDGFFA